MLGGSEQRTVSENHSTALQCEEAVVWFAMSAPYRKELAAKSWLDRRSIESFVPMHYAVRNRRGRKSREQIPVISNLIFVRSTKSEIQNAKSEIGFLQYLTRREGGRNVPIIVPDEQMHQFMAVVQTRNEHLVYLRPEEVNLQSGTNVRILGGPFDGVEGVFVKVQGYRSRRVVVLVEGIAALATAEIEPDLIEVIK